MNRHFTQLNDGVSADVETASAVEAAIGMVLLAFLLQFFWRCCCSCYRNHVKRYLSFSSYSACNMDPSTIADVESILNYTFKNKNLLVEALTHSSFSKNMSYERLEFVGDAALGLAVATHFFRLEQQKLNPGQLTKLREESVSNSKLAHMAAKHGLYWFVRRKDTASLDHNVKKYEEEVKQGDDHPDILADIVESLAGAVYLDVNFDLTELWKIFKDILEVDKIMLPKDGGDGSSEITGAQDELYGLCGKRKWENPVYRLEKDEGRPHEKKFVSSVKIQLVDGTRYVTGDEKSTVKDAENSAASFMIRDLQESGYL
ncbi:hypothetical protein CRYUN_Cryun39dG0017600 [Craigia yunnanensis]